MKLDIKKILVPTDFSEISICAVDYAAHIAHVTGAELILLHVFEPGEQKVKGKSKAVMSEELERGINEQLEEVKANNRRLWGLRLQSKVTYGKIHLEIIREARKEKVDLVVMGTHGASGLSDLTKLFLGSNAYRTVSRAPCPVLTVHTLKKNIHFKDIILPIDSTRESKRKVDLAIHWARLFNSTIHLLSLTAFLNEFSLESKKLKILSAEIEQKLKKEKIPFHSRLIRGKSISGSVIDYARKNNADLIFIVTGKEYAISEILGASAQKNIITDSPVPVLSLHFK